MFSYFTQIDLFNSFTSIGDWFFALFEGQISPPPLALFLLLLSFLIIYAPFWIFKRRRKRKQKGVVQQAQSIEAITPSETIQLDDELPKTITPEPLTEDITPTPDISDISDIEREVAKKDEPQVASTVTEPEQPKEPAQSNSTNLYFDPHLVIPKNSMAGLSKRKTLDQSTIRRWQKVLRAKTT